MSILQQIDLARQTKEGEDFVLSYKSGGTGRTDGRAAGLVRLCGGATGLAEMQPVKLNYQGGAHGTGSNVLVGPLTAITDIPFGVALAPSTYDYELIPVVIQGSAQVLATGPIAAGDRLYPTASGRVSATRPPNNEGWSMGRAMGAISGAVDGTVWMLVESVADRVPFEPAGVNIIMGVENVVLSPGTRPNDVELPMTGTIESVRLLARQAGSIVIDIWKDTYANYPPTVADSICAAAKPTLSSASKSQDTTLTGWNKAVNKGDIMRFNIDSVSIIEQLTLSLVIIKEVS